MNKIKHHSLFKWQDNSAFTLVEAIFALFIVVLIMLILQGNAKSIATYKNYQLKNNILPSLQFRHALEYHLGQEQVISVAANSLQTEKDGKRYYYDFARQKIYRRGENGGHEPLLVNVSSAYFKKEKKYIIANVVLENGEQWSYYVRYSEKITE